MQGSRKSVKGWWIEPRLPPEIRSGRKNHGGAISIQELSLMGFYEVPHMTEGKTS